MACKSKQCSAETRKTLAESITKSDESDSDHRNSCGITLCLFVGYARESLKGASYQNSLAAGSANQALTKVKNYLYHRVIALERCF